MLQSCSFRRLPRLLAGVAGLYAAVALALDPSGWPYHQPILVSTSGLVRVALPPATLGATRPDLGDLRLLDPTGGEVPFALDRLLPEPARIAAPKSFHVTLGAGGSQILIETGLTQAVESVALRTGSPAFIKAVRVEGSTDGRLWTVLAQGAPIFRQDGNTQLGIAFAPAPWAWLRLSVDDQRSAPVAFTGVTIRAAAAETPTVMLPAEVVNRIETDRTSRLSLRLPAPNLLIASLELDSPELLFMRELELLAPVVGETATNEVELAAGTIYRLALDEHAAPSNLVVEVEARAPSRELVLRIRNLDSPPLAITGVRVRVRPAQMLFRAPAAGRYVLLTGNRDCARPHYDLASLGERFSALPAAVVEPGPLSENPAFRAAAALPGVQDRAAALDVTAWRFRKPVQVGAAGVQRLEMDLETLANARPDLGDVRLMRGAIQVPYLRDTAEGTHRFAPTVTTADDPKRPDLSRWQLTLPHPRLPLAQLSCGSPTLLFQRRVELYEEIHDRERGLKYRRSLGSAEWRQTPGESSRKLVLLLGGAPESDSLLLETANGDNPPIVLEEFEFTAPAPRLVFKLDGPADDLFLYFGNPAASAPSYDLSLVAADVQAAFKAPAVLGVMEQLKPGQAWRFGPAGTGGPVLWVVLATVAASLVVLIIRLLPTPSDPGGGSSSGDSGRAG